MRRLFTDKIENMRDIGGYAINNNEIVKEGKLFRSNCITNLENEEIKQLIKIGISQVIDLRSDEEIQKKKGIFVDNHTFIYNHIGLKGNGRLPDSKSEVVDSYIEMLEGKEQIKEIFDILGKTEGGIIYYCNAGKDRTGVITACILKLLGVSDKDIIADYMASGIFLKEMLQNFSNSITNKDIFSIINPNYDTMYNLLGYVNNQYGSMTEYLKSCEVSNETLETIKSKYIQKIV